MAIKWSNEEHRVTVSVDQDLAWNDLVRALGLPNKLDLPHFLNSDKSFPDEIHQGMRLEVVGASSGTVIPATLSLWRPQERRFTVTLHVPDDPYMKPWRHYEFSVHPSSEAGRTEIRLTLSNARSLFHLVVIPLIELLERDGIKYAEAVLIDIVQRFPPPHYLS